MLFTLRKLCYRACNDEERGIFDSLGTDPVELRVCCMILVGRPRVRHAGNAEIDLRQQRPRDLEEAMVREFEQEQWWDSRNMRFRTMGSAACVLAAANGHLDCLTDAWRKGYGWDHLTVEAAARNGHLDCLRFAREHGCPWDHATAKIAAHHGRLECLRYALEAGCPATVGLCWEAALKGQLECLRLARELYRCPWDETVTAAAAHNGHMNCLVYLHRNGCPWGPFANLIAAAAGRLGVLRYAHLNGCAWDRWSVTAAACHGHVACLKFLRQNGCEWTAMAYRAAAAGGHAECLAYMDQHGCPRDRWSLDVIEGAIRPDGPDSCPWGDVTCPVDELNRSHFQCLVTAYAEEVENDVDLE